MNFRQYLTRNLPPGLPPGYELLSKEALIFEAIINPGKLNINGTSLEYLNSNKELKKLNISFKKGDDLRGWYRQKTDEIIIEIPDKFNKIELEALIGHEIIHREQQKRSKGKFEEFSKRTVDKINNLVKEFNNLPNNKTKIEHDKLLNFFRYENIYEQMAYAYQLVKDRKTFEFKSVNDIVKYFEKYLNIKMPNDFRKYIGMYWIIKDKL